VKVLHMAAVELGLDVVENRGRAGPQQPAHHTAGGAGPAFLLLGHTDVVRSAMTGPPTRSRHVHDGRMYGRGTLDMKGGLAASLAALAALRGVA